MATKGQVDITLQINAQAKEAQSQIQRLAEQLKNVKMPSALGTSMTREIQKAKDALTEYFSLYSKENRSLKDENKMAATLNKADEAGRRLAQHLEELGRSDLKNLLPTETLEKFKNAQTAINNLGKNYEDIVGKQNKAQEQQNGLIEQRKKLIEDTRKLEDDRRKLEQQKSSQSQALATKQAEQIAKQQEIARLKAIKKGDIRNDEAKKLENARAIRSDYLSKTASDSRRNKETVLSTQKKELEEITEKAENYRNAIEKVDKAYEDYKKHVSTGKAKSKEEWLTSDSKTAKATGVSLEQYNEMQSTVTHFNQLKTSVEGTEQELNESLSTFNKAVDTINQFDEKIAQTTQDEKGIRDEITELKGELDSTNTALNKTNNTITNNIEKINESKKTIDELQNTYNQLGTQANEAFIKIREAVEKALGDKLPESVQNLDQLKEHLNTLRADEAEKVNNALREMASTLQNATKASGNAANKQNDLQRELNETAREAKDSQREIDNLSYRFKQLFSLTSGINILNRSIRRAFETIKELDEVMTQTAVVSDYTVSDMWSMLPQYTKNAQALGVAISDVYSAQTLYIQQGLDFKNSMDLGIESLKMARIANIDAANATQAMTAALRGFNMELNETSAKRVNDVYSELAKITAADTQQISTAMTKTASIAHSANMEFETTAALLSQIIETTQEAPETAGTAMKTIIGRFTEIKKLYSKGELEGTDDEGEAIQVNRVSTALRAAGINLNEFFTGAKGLDDIFLELSKKWNTLDIVTQRYIATMAAGSRQQSRFIAMMQDYARTTELVSAAENSAGSSQKQFNKTLDSMQSKLTSLKDSWQQFTMGIMNAEWAKQAIDLAQGFLDKINQITDSSNSLISVLTKIGTIAGGLKLGSILVKGTGSLISKKIKPNAMTNTFGKILGNQGAGGVINGLIGTIINSVKKGKSNLVASALLDEKAFQDQGVFVGEAVAKGMQSALASSKLLFKEKTSLAWMSDIGQSFQAKHIDSLKQYVAELTKNDLVLQMNNKDLQAYILKLSSANAVTSLSTKQTAKYVIQALFAGKATRENAAAQLALSGATHTSTVALIAERVAMNALPLGWVIAGITAIIAVTALLVKHFKNLKIESLEEQIEKSNKRLEDTKNKIKAINEEIDSLKDKRNALNELSAGFENLIKGTNEWNKQLFNSNQQVLDLIQQYPKLAEYVEKGQHGQLVISDEGWKQLEDEQMSYMRQAYQTQLFEQEKNNRLLQRQILDNFYENEWKSLKQGSMTETAESAYNAAASESENGEFSSETVQAIENAFLAYLKRFDSNATLVKNDNGGYTYTAENTPTETTFEEMIDAVRQDIDFYATEDRIREEVEGGRLPGDKFEQELISQDQIEAIIKSGLSINKANEQDLQELLGINNEDWTTFWNNLLANADAFNEAISNFSQTVMQGDIQIKGIFSQIAAQSDLTYAEASGAYLGETYSKNLYENTDKKYLEAIERYGLLENFDKNGIRRKNTEIATDTTEYKALMKAYADATGATYFMGKLYKDATMSEALDVDTETLLAAVASSQATKELDKELEKTNNFLSQLINKDSDKTTGETFEELIAGNVSNVGAKEAAAMWLNKDYLDYFNSLELLKMSGIELSEEDYNSAIKEFGNEDTFKKYLISQMTKVAEGYEQIWEDGTEYFTNDFSERLTNQITQLGLSLTDTQNLERAFRKVATSGGDLNKFSDLIFNSILKGITDQAQKQKVVSYIASGDYTTEEGIKTTINLIKQLGITLDVDLEKELLSTVRIAKTFDLEKVKEELKEIQKLADTVEKNVGNENRTYSKDNITSLVKKLDQQWVNDNFVQTGLDEYTFIGDQNELLTKIYNETIKIANQQKDSLTESVEFGKAIKEGFIPSEGAKSFTVGAGEYTWEEIFEYYGSGNVTSENVQKALENGELQIRDVVNGSAELQKLFVNGIDGLTDYDIFHVILKGYQDYYKNLESNKASLSDIDNEIGTSLEGRQKALAITMAQKMGLDLKQVYALAENYLVDDKIETSSLQSAIAELLLREGQKALNGAKEDITALQDTGSTKGDSAARTNLNETLKKMYGFGDFQSNLSKEFLEDVNNLKLMQLAAEGNKEAIIELGKAVREELGKTTKNELEEINSDFNKSILNINNAENALKEINNNLDIDDKKLQDLFATYAKAVWNIDVTFSSEGIATGTMGVEVEPEDQYDSSDYRSFAEELLGLKTSISESLEKGITTFIPMLSQELKNAMVTLGYAEADQFQQIGDKFMFTGEQDAQTIINLISQILGLMPMNETDQAAVRQKELEGMTNNQLVKEIAANQQDAYYTLLQRYQESGVSTENYNAIAGKQGIYANYSNEELAGEMVGFMQNQEATSNLDLNPDLIREQTEELMRLNEAMGMDRETAEALAIAYQAWDKYGQEAVNKWKDWQKVLNSSKASEQEKNEVYLEMTDTLNKMLGGTMKLSSSFLKTGKNMELFKKAAEGDNKALNELRKNAAKTTFKEMLKGMGKTEKESEKLLNAYDKIQDMLTSIGEADWADNKLDWNDSLQTQQFLAACNEMVNAAGMTVGEVEELFSNMGYDAEVVQDEVHSPYEIKLPAGTYGPPGSQVTWDALDIKGEQITHPVAIKSITPKGGSGGKIHKPSGGGGGGGGGGEKKEPWKNSFDRFHNLKEAASRTDRERNKLEREYNNLLKEQANILNKNDFHKNLLAQVDALKQQVKYSKDLVEYYDELAKGKNWEAVEWMKQNADLKQFLEFDDETDEILIDWDRINQITDQDEGSHLEEVYQKLEEFRNAIWEAEDNRDEAIDKQNELIETLADTYRDLREAFLTMEERIRDAIYDARQKEIDELDAIYEAQDNNNSKILDGINEIIDEQRKAREQQKQRDELEEKQRRLTLLRQDTSGANSLEILALEKELAESQENYIDSLVDNALEEISKGNEKAQEQRDMQIELLQWMLDYDKEHGAFWDEVTTLMNDAYDEDGQLKRDSALVKLLQSTEEFEALSAFGQDKWWDDLRAEMVKAQEGSNIAKILLATEKIEADLAREHLQTGNNQEFRRDKGTNNGSATGGSGSGGSGGSGGDGGGKKPGGGGQKFIATYDITSPYTGYHESGEVVSTQSQELADAGARRRVQQILNDEFEKWKKVNPEKYAEQSEKFNEASTFSSNGAIDEDLTEEELQARGEEAARKLAEERAAREKQKQIDADDAEEAALAALAEKHKKALEAEAEKQKQIDVDDVEEANLAALAEEHRRKLEERRESDREARIDEADRIQRILESISTDETSMPTEEERQAKIDRADAYDKAYDNILNTAVAISNASEDKDDDNNPIMTPAQAMEAYKRAQTVEKRGNVVEPGTDIISDNDEQAKIAAAIRAGQMAGQRDLLASIDAEDAAEAAYDAFAKQHKLLINSGVTMEENGAFIDEGYNKNGNGTQAERWRIDALYEQGLLPAQLRKKLQMYASFADEDTNVFKDPNYLNKLLGSNYTVGQNNSGYYISDSNGNVVNGLSLDQAIERVLDIANIDSDEEQTNRGTAKSASDEILSLANRLRIDTKKNGGLNPEDFINKANGAFSTLQGASVSYDQQNGVYVITDNATGEHIDSEFQSDVIETLEQWQQQQQQKEDDTNTLLSALSEETGLSRKQISDLINEKGTAGIEQLDALYQLDLDLSDEEKDLMVNQIRQDKEIGSKNEQSLGIINSSIGDAGQKLDALGAIMERVNQATGGRNASYTDSTGKKWTWTATGADAGVNYENWLLGKINAVEAQIKKDRAAINTPINDSSTPSSKKRSKDLKDDIDKLKEDRSKSISPEEKNKINNEIKSKEDELKKIKKFDTGGYTGDWHSSEGRLAMLHQKELVLNATDTSNFIQLRDILRDMDIGNPNTGITNYEIHIEVDEISDDYSVEQLADKVKDLIVEESNYRNVNQINTTR